VCFRSFGRHRRLFGGRRRWFGFLDFFLGCQGFLGHADQLLEKVNNPGPAEQTEETGVGISGTVGALIARHNPASKNKVGTLATLGELFLLLKRKTGEFRDISFVYYYNYVQ